MDLGGCEESGKQLAGTWEASGSYLVIRRVLEVRKTWRQLCSKLKCVLMLEIGTPASGFA